MATMSVDAIRSALLQESLGRLGGAGGVKGLLTPTQTPLQAGLLGGMQQLQPFTGYTTTPTTFGQAIGAGLMGAAGGVQKQKGSDIASALKGLELYSALDTDDDLSDFEKQFDEYTKLALIPEGQRSEKQKVRFEVLEDKLKDQAPQNSLLNVVMSAYGKDEDKRSPFEKDAIEKWKKSGDIYTLLAQAAGNGDISGSAMSTESSIEMPGKFDFAKNYSAEQILNLMNNIDDKDAEDLYNSLDPEKVEEVSELYNQLKQQES